jgi:peptide/nickel transport system ATP-binding protein
VAQLINTHQPLQDVAAAGLLKIRGLAVEFANNGLPIEAVRGVDLELGQGEILGLVGESGSGKSVTCQALMGLLPKSARLTGQLLINGSTVQPHDTRVLSTFRGRSLSMIFQDPMSALDPLMTVRQHLLQRLRRHKVEGDLEALAHALLRRAGVPDGGRILDAYSHQLSGGLCQRVVIALALAGSPQILIADEPTTALDVTTQAQVLDLLAELRQTAGLGVILVSHDLGVVAEICDRVAVMYAGQIVETGPTTAVLTTPGHPYAQGLINSRPSLDGPRGALKTIPGSAVTPNDLPEGCAFAPRCAYAMTLCNHPPPYNKIAPERWSRCHFLINNNDSATSTLSSQRIGLLSRS